MPFPKNPTTNFKDSNQVDLGDKLVTKDYLLEVYGSILENSPASGLVVTPQLWGWGQGGSGRLGNSEAENKNTPVISFSGTTVWKQVSSGDQHTVAIKTDGTLWVFGRNDRGQLGTNDVLDKDPVTTFAGGTDWKSVAACKNNTYTTAIKTDGSLWTWGNNDNGQLGDNTTTARSTPVTTFVGGTNWKSASAGLGHMTAIKSDGTLWTWGRNDEGALGDNTTTARSTPVTTFAGGNTWKSVSGGRSHTAAIKTDGTLWTWGRNGSGELGINNTANRSNPVTTFAGGNDWKSVSCGSRHTVAIKTDGTLWTWGTNTDAQLGTNDTTQRNTPVTTFAGGTNWKSVSGGGGYAISSFTLAIKTDGTLWTWGANTLGKLGTNDTNTRTTPVTTFAGGNDWKQVSCGGNHTMAIRTIDYI